MAHALNAVRQKHERERNVLDTRANFVKLLKAKEDYYKSVFDGKEPIREEAHAKEDSRIPRANC